jgi:hypothetical protein
VLARVLVALSLAACARPLTPGEGTTDTKMKPRIPTGAWQRDCISRHGGPRFPVAGVPAAELRALFPATR